ncbi:MAG: Na/Pi cotransporter family protein [Defluviitaleaceae bacterium]|nr:Na/Pi cotransporter family protein [Defluviitaleaceae bacterium]
MNSFWIILNMLGGLTIFIFALKAIGDGLQEVTSKKAGRVLEILTSVPIVGMLVGTAVTMAVQSSTVVTVMVVSLVNASLMNLKQAASVIMGANIGTTLTAQLVAFRITDWWVMLSFVGFAVYILAKPKHIKTIGYVFFALGLLLLGMALMSDAMRPLRGNEGFENLMLMFADNRVLAMLVGVVFTALIQSSTAATGVVIAMAMGDGYGSESLIPLSAALPIIFGANIGTCFTAVLASINGSVSAKRAAMIHVVFNTVGASIFLIFLPQFEWVVLAISPEYDVPRQAANAHLIFSVVSTAMFLPFISQLVKLVTIIIPERKTNEFIQEAKITKHLEWQVVDNPAIAMQLAQLELLHMAGLAGQNINLAIEGLLDRKKKTLKKMKRQEKTVDKLEKEIIRYLTAMSQAAMGKSMSIRHAGLMHAANDIERVSDHARNIARHAQNLIENDIHFPPKALQEIEKMLPPLVEIYETAVQSVRENNLTLATKVKSLESTIDLREKAMRSAHIARMLKGELSAEAGAIFLEMLADFERISDHSVNISHLPQERL